MLELVTNESEKMPPVNLKQCEEVLLSPIMYAAALLMPVQATRACVVTAGSASAGHTRRKIPRVIPVKPRRRSPVVHSSSGLSQVHAGLAFESEKQFEISRLLQIGLLTRRHWALSNLVYQLRTLWKERTGYDLYVVLAGP